MVWNSEACQQEPGEDVVVLSTQPCPLSSSLNLDPSPSGQSESDEFVTNVVVPPVGEYPESFNNSNSTTEHLMNMPVYPFNGNGFLQMSQSTMDNLPFNEIESWETENDPVPALDNANINQNGIGDGTDVKYYDVSKEVSSRHPRTRQDSTDSRETVDFTSSGEIFNSDYTDTISSVESTAFLLKPSSDSDEELSAPVQLLQDSYYNEVYMSCSSSEMLNETERDEEIVKVENCAEDPDETEALLEVCVEVGQAPVNQEAGGDNSESKDEETQNMDEFVLHPLVPIHENKVITFNVEEVNPTEYVTITNNIISVDESFLFHSNSSLWDLHGGKDGNRAVTMQNLHERSSFQDLTEVSKISKACQKALLYIKDDINFGSMASLNTIANKQMEKDPMQSVSLISDAKGIDVVESNKHMKNLLALSFCLTLLYIAIGSVRNLQSSINHEGGVGVLSMAFNSIGYTLGSLFSASIVLNFQPRKCIIVNLIPNLLYVASNIYPTIWLMLPCSLIQGIAMAIIWNAVSTYVTFLSRGRTEKTGEASDQVSSRYFGILCLMYQSHLIIGNLIASLVLMPGGAGNSINETVPHTIANLTDLQVSNLTLEYHDSATPAAESLSPVGMEGSILNVSTDKISSLSLCGAKFCHHFDMGGSGFAVSDETKYLLFGIYMGCILLSLLIAVFFMEPLNQRLFVSSVRPLQKLKTQLSSLICFFVDIKFILLLPLLMYSVIQFGFVTAEFTKAFVTCSLGIHMVGYTMICFGICGALSSYVGGLLTRFTGRIPLFIFGRFLGVLFIFTKPLNF